MKSKGVYLIRNNVNQKIYIGSTFSSFAERWYNHKNLLSRNKHCNPYLQRAWNKYGEDAFVFLVLEDMPDATPEEIVEAEQWYFDNVKTHIRNGGGYNIATDASASARGMKLTEETKQKMSKAKMGKTPCLGYKHTEETKRNMSEAKMGNTSRLGHKHTEETKRKISEVQVGNTYASKLKECEVLEIRRLYATGKVILVLLGKMFGVRHSTIHRIVTRKSWRHI